MREGPDIASLAALLGDPARAAMLTALMGGQALTAGELAAEAGIAPQTASAHLARLAEAGLVVREVQGRHRYARLAGPEVAEALEGLMGLAARTGRLRARPGPRDEAMRRARVCYDHLAGSLGVRLHDVLVGSGAVVAAPEGLALTPLGCAWLVAQGVDVGALEARRRPLCRACLDWSERRHHLAGSVGATLLDLVLARGWATRDPQSRALLFCAMGLARFEALVGTWDEAQAAS
jgi:DNA-binding transcriptional ArsR family regulator